MHMKSSEKLKLFFSVLVRLIKKKEMAILSANEKDVQKARRPRLSQPFIQRLQMHDKDIELMVKRVRDVGRMKNSVGDVIEKRRLKNGIVLEKVCVPIGTILVIYESRPEVTIDIAILGIKSGNKILLKGGSDAQRTNFILFRIIQEALRVAQLPKECVQLLKLRSKKELYNLLTKRELIDLVIARGGYEMVQIVQEKSKIPVLAHSAGGARIYIDESADLEMAQKIILNAKTNKPAACNSLDTILVHKKIAHEFIPVIKGLLESQRVKVSDNLDWNMELVDLVVGIKIVHDANDAIAFIKKYTKKHTEGIVSTDKNVIALFKKEIDAATLCINCSTRLHDGGIFGMGAEMGIATGKLHARGPVGARELMTYKWVMEGEGQIRE